MSSRIKKRDFAKLLAFAIHQSQASWSSMLLRLIIEGEMVEGCVIFSISCLEADYLDNLNYLNCDLDFNSETSILKLSKRT